MDATSSSLNSDASVLYFVRELLESSLEKLETLSVSIIQEKLKATQYGPNVTRFVNNENNALSDLIDSELSRLAAQIVEVSVEEAMRRAVQDAQRAGRPVSRRRRCQVPHPDAAPLPRVLPLQETPAKPSSSSAVPVSQIPTPDHNTENDEVSSNNFSDLPLSIDVTSAKANISSPVTFGVREATRRPRRSTSQSWTPDLTSRRISEDFLFALYPNDALISFAGGHADLTPREYAEIILEYCRCNELPYVAKKRCFKADKTLKAICQQRITTLPANIHQLLDVLEKNGALKRLED